MHWDHDERQRRARNYRLMFRGALACLLLSAFFTLAGGIMAIAGGDTMMLVYGLLMLIWSVGSAYLTVDSTVRILELETMEMQQRSG